MAQLVNDPLPRGRDAVGRHAWQQAFELLSAADADGGLAPEDLEAIGNAAWWTGRLEECITARERAYTTYLQQGERRRAAMLAMALAKDYYAKLASSIGSAWVDRAERLLADEAECVEHGYLARLHSVIAFEGRGDLDMALEEARSALRIAERYGDRDLQAIAIGDEGRVLVADGHVSEGLRRVDEATVAAVSGELGPLPTGIIYCNTIAICEQLADWRRAGEWTDAARRWCERQSISGFPGICRVHRAEIMRLRGAWADAEQEARRACDELREFNLSAAAEAFYEIGEIRLRLEDLPAAEAAFLQAHELGRDPQPGLAELRLAEGKVEAALSCIHSALDEESHELKRSRLLPAHVNIALEARVVDAAHRSADELEEIARKYGTPALEAKAQAAHGAVRLAEGDAAEALRPLRRARRLWQELDLPYETAQARLMAGQAARLAGDEENAVLELRAACAGFETLGARAEVRRVAELLGSADGTVGHPGAQRAKPTLMFTDMVGSTSLIEAIGDEAWKDLVAWHDKTLRSLFAEYQGKEIDHAGDGFFIGFAAAERAVECAVAVQRRLAEHRRAYGFAPRVRIGIHATEATRLGPGYAGRGVHEAARIGALAESGEILVSSQTLAAVPPRFPTSEPREVTLKGISAPVEIASIDWR